MKIIEVIILMNGGFQVFAVTPDQLKATIEKVKSCIRNKEWFEFTASEDLYVAFDGSKIDGFYTRIAAPSAVEQILELSKEALKKASDGDNWKSE